MKKLIRLWMRITSASVLWVVIPVILYIAIRVFQYGYPFQSLSEDDLKVYQLALTAFAATVGIGTVVNSTRSADSSRKSIEITRNKELREQSSHLIARSQISNFAISPPMYKIDHDYSPTKYVATTLYDLNFTGHDSQDSYDAAKQNFEKSLQSIHQERIDEYQIINMLQLLNIGKGVCLNVEYSFEIENIKAFDEYSVLYNETKQGKYEIMSPSFYPSYDFVVKKYKTHLRILTIDHTILSLANEASMDESAQIYYSESDINFFDSKEKTYIPFIKPGEDTYLPIPNEFMILCKHYLVMYVYKKRDKESPFSRHIRPGIQHLIEGEAISPVGRVAISYMDEEDVREKRKAPIRKELTFEVRIKDESIYQHDEELRFYLEFIPVS